MLRIDCHTHIVTPEIRDAYFAGTDGYALVMQMPESLMPNPECIPTVCSDPRLFLCACIDLKQAIVPQLRRLEPKLEEWKVVGLKIYLTYQKGRADDMRLVGRYPLIDHFTLFILDCQMRSRKLLSARTVHDVLLGDLNCDR